MSSVVSGRRITATLMFAFAIVAAYDLLFEQPQLAGFNKIKQSGKSLAAKFAGQDAVTNAIRRESSVLTRIQVRSKEERDAAARVGTIVEDYGSFVLVERGKEIEAKRYNLEEQEVETTVNLPGASFDPLKQPPAGSLRLGTAATADGDGYYVLQFGGTATDEWLNSVRHAGVEVLQYVSNQAYFVYGDSAAIARVADHSRVRWVGRYTTEQKISPIVRRQLNAARGGAALARGITPIEKTRKGTALFDVGIFARADLDKAASELQENFGRGFLQISDLGHNFFNVVRIELSLDDVEKVAAMPDVVGIGVVGKTENEDERSSQILAGNYINGNTLTGSGYNPLSQFGVDGSNVTVSVVDDGVGIPGDGGYYISSANAVNGPLRGSQPGALGHGHFNATIIAGSSPYGPNDPLFFSYGKGVAPGANIVSIPRNRVGYSGTDAEVYDDSVSTPGPNGSHALISNNSWGNGLNSASYEFLTEGKFDGFVQDASIGAGIDPLTMIFSAGNSGPGPLTLTRPKAAKNLIVVGNSEGLRNELGGTSANNIDDMADDSSHGPTADGRIKPDIVAPGTAITGGRSGSDFLRGNLDNFHRWSSGTSHSAANITGVAALFANFWYQTDFNRRPSPSLIRAALINAAVDMNGEGSTAPIPNAAEGWGRPNLKTMLAPNVGMNYVNDANTLDQTGKFFDLPGSVADSSKPVRVTLAWTDPPGVSDPPLVNNLDLIVTVGGVTYKGNVFSNGVSVTGGSADTKNNVENVFLPAGIPAGTSLRIRTVATSLNGDGVLNNGDGTDQNYSIVVYNWSGLVSPNFYTLAGKIVSPSGRGIPMARVVATDSQGVQHATLSNHFGYFRLPTGDDHLPGNQQYTITVTAKRYTFVTRTVNLNGNLTNEVIVSSSGSP